MVVAAVRMHEQWWLRHAVLTPSAAGAPGCLGAPSLSNRRISSGAAGRVSHPDDERSLRPKRMWLFLLYHRYLVRRWGRRFFGGAARRRCSKGLVGRRHRRPRAHGGGCQSSSGATEAISLIALMAFGLPRRVHPRTLPLRCLKWRCCRRRHRVCSTLLAAGAQPAAGTCLRGPRRGGDAGASAVRVPSGGVLSGGLQAMRRRRQRRRRRGRRGGRGREGAFLRLRGVTILALSAGAGLFYSHLGERRFDVPA